jgi:uncharacterized protein YjiS (DUF1127 family)
LVKEGIMSENSTALVVRSAAARPSWRAGGIVGLIARIARNWRNRRHLRRLEHLDDHLLSDIGLTRTDLSRLRSLPLGCDPAASLNRTVACNRAAEAENARPARSPARPDHMGHIFAL